MKDLIINSKYSFRVSKPRLACTLIKINAQFNTACVKYKSNIHPLIINYHVWIRPGTYINRQMYLIFTNCQ
jgi:hypothetical protein